MTDAKRMLLPQSLVQALLSGATQVSVPVKPQPWSDERDGEAWWHWRSNHGAVHARSGQEFDLSPYAPLPIGTEVWVPETWCPYADEMTKEYCQAHDPWWGEPIKPAVYAADYGKECPPLDVGGCEHWRSPVTMPSWAARLRYEVEGVKAGRAWDATYQDALLEGWHPVIGHIELPITNQGLVDTAHDWYKVHWNAACPAYPWSTNPWRLTYSLRRL